MIVQPHVDFGLKLLGADAMAIPGLYGFVQVPVLTFCMVKHGLNLFLHDLCPCNQYVLFFYALISQYLRCFCKPYTECKMHL